MQRAFSDFPWSKISTPKLPTIILWYLTHSIHIHESADNLYLHIILESRKQWQQWVQLIGVANENALFATGFVKT